MPPSMSKASPIGVKAHARNLRTPLADPLNKRLLHTSILLTVNTQSQDGGILSEGIPSRPAKLLRWSLWGFSAIWVHPRS